MPEQLSRKQVELILRRTAELEQRDDDALEGLTPAELEKVADELGLSHQALNQAIAESRAGMLAPEGERTLVDRMFGGRLVEVRRFVPGNAASIRAAVDRFLEEQGFQIKRNRSGVQLWEASTDWSARLRRAFRAGPYRLPRDIEIEVTVADVPGGPHPVLVGLRVDAARARTTRVSAATASVLAGAAIAVGGALALPMPTEILTFAGAGLAGIGGTLGARRSYRSARDQLALALERFLDFLEQPPRLPDKPRDPITRLVDFLSGEWWR